MRFRHLIYTLFFCWNLLTGCGPSESSANVPSDFHLIVDAHSVVSDGKAPAQNVNIEIYANGKVVFDRYNTNGVISFDEDHMVTYSANQVIETGKFELNSRQLESLWDAIEAINFFALTDDYRMSIGLAYTFMMVEANGQRHVVDNIGLEMAEMKTIAALLNTFLPEEAMIVYREGFLQ